MRRDNVMGNKYHKVTKTFYENGVATREQISLERIKIEDALWYDKKNDAEAKAVVKLIKRLFYEYKCQYYVMDSKGRYKCPLI